MMRLLAFILSLLLVGCQSLSVDYIPEHEPETLYRTLAGLPTGVMYQYKYTGTVATWISEDPTQSSRSALRADLRLERLQDGNLRVKVDNVEVAEAHEKASCDPQKYLEFSYHPMDQDQATLLEQPFLIQVDETGVLSIKVPGEPLWVTNIRRGIINSLPLPILTGHGSSRLTFRLTEDTMIGQCHNWYSQLKLPSYQAALKNKEQEKEIEVDVQRYTTAESYTQSSKTGQKGRSKVKRPTKTSKTSSKTGTKTGTKTRPGTPDPPGKLILPINDTLWVLTRTLDNEGCEENHFTVKINSNPKSVDRTQRSSQGTFLIRGEQGAGMRLERAEVNGDIIVYTADCYDKFIRTMTKQVVELRAVRHAEVHVEGAQELEIKALKFERKEGAQLFTVEEQLTGIYPTELQVQATITKIKEDLELIGVAEPGDSEDAPAFLDTFLRVVERIAVLTKSQIELLVSQAPDTPKVKKVLYQALLTSGTNEALTLLLEKLNDAPFRLDNTNLMFKIFQATTITIRDPSLIPKLLNLVSKMGEDERYSEEPLKTTSLLSIARLAHQYCLDPQSAEGCDQRCDNDEIINSFLPILTEGLQSPYKWKKLVHLQAMCTLGTPHILPWLEPIIQGKNKDDVDLRVSAIYCLSAEYLPKTAHSMAMDILVPLLNNPTEFPEVRSIAFLMISTWEPTNLSWWEFIAFSTWRENSTQVAAFISTALKSLSEGKDPRSINAKKVIHLAKHPDKEAFSLSNSAYLYLDEDVKNCKEGTKWKLAWLTSMQSILPRTVVFSLQLTTVLGMSRNEMAVYFSDYLQRLYKDSYASTWDVKEDEDSETFYEIFEDLKEHLMLTSTNFIPDDMFAFYSIFRPLHLILSFFPGEYHPAITNIDFNTAPVHFRLTDSTLAFPSDLGLPVIVKLEEDLSWNVNILNVPPTIPVFVELNHKHSVNVKTLVPWTEGQAVGAGLEANTLIFLPITVNIGMRQPKIDFQLPSNKTTLVVLSGSMYTSLTPLFPFTGAALGPDEPGTSLGRNPVWRRDMSGSSTNVLLLSQLGIHMTSVWVGDFPQPSFSTALTELDPFVLNYQNFEYKLVFDPSRSQSNVISFTWNYYKKEIKVAQETEEQTSQVSQGAADYEFMTQVSGGAPDYEFFGQTSSGGPDFEDQSTQSETVTTHLRRVEEQTTTFIHGVSHTVSLTIEPNAGPRKFEFVFTPTLSKWKRIGQKIPLKFHVTFVNSSVTEIFADKHWTCIDTSLARPYLLPLLPKEVLNTDLSSQLLFNLYDAGYCEGQPTLQIKAFEDQSRTALEYVQAKVEKEACDGSYPQRLVPLYDTMNFEITGDQDHLNDVVALQVWATYNLDSNLLKVVDIVRDIGSYLDTKITATASLDLVTNLWNLHIQGPHGTFLYSVSDFGLTDLIAPSFTQGYMFDVVSSNLDKVCYLTGHSIRTFDGLVHEFEPSSCWTTATIHIAEREAFEFEKYQELSVQARYNDEGWEVRLIWPFSALMLDITRSEILVNEEPFTGQSDKFVVHQLQDSQLIEAGLVLLWVGDTVEIRISDMYYGEVTGLCGNYDGEPTNDMRGPLGCLYTDPTLLTTAWSSSASGCSRLALRSKRRKLEPFQETCEREAFQPTGLTQYNAMENCTTWQYQERISPAGLSCTSRVPVPVCQPGCQAGLTYTSNLKYDCLVPSSSDGQQQQQYASSSQCLSKVLPAIIPSGCFH